MKANGCGILVMPVFLVLAAASAQAAAIYQITDLGVLPGGSASSAAALSSNGWVAGTGDTADGSPQPFVGSAAGLAAVDVGSPYAFGLGVNASGTIVGWGFNEDNSTFFAFSSDGPIPTLGGATNTATAINDAGMIVGYSDTATGGEMAFAYSASGGIVPLGTLPGGTDSRAYGVNNSGAVVGRAIVGGAVHAFVLSGGTWTDIGASSGYESSEAVAISDAGQVAGTLDDGAGQTMAFLWTSSLTGSTLDLLDPSLTHGNSRAYGVNSSGFVVGSYRVVGSSDNAAFLYDGSLRDLNSLIAAPEWQLIEGAAINDLGQIVGTGHINGEQHAFLLDPTSSVPEPSCLWFAASGLLAVSGFRRLRKEMR